MSLLNYRKRGFCGVSWFLKQVSIMRIFLLVTVSVLVASHASGEILHLNNGETIEGEIIQETEDQVVLSLNEGTVTFERSEIAKIEALGTSSSGKRDGLFTRWSRAVSRTWWKAKNKVKSLYRDSKKSFDKKYAKLMKPLERSAATKAKEVRLETTLKQMEISLKEAHQAEKEAFKTQRELASGY